MVAQPSASIFKERPGPALPVTARWPVYENPRAVEMAAISSSHCTNMPPYFGNSLRSISMIEDQGVIG
jgi:hypothetical protein